MSAAVVEPTPQELVGEAMPQPVPIDDGSEHPDRETSVTVDNEVSQDSEETAVCVLHNKKRKKILLEEREDGTFACLAGSECKMKTPNEKKATANPTVSQAVAQKASVAAANDVGTDLVVCALHHKKRSVRNMVQVGENLYQCRHDFQCQMKGQPERLPMAAPGLQPMAFGGLPPPNLPTMPQPQPQFVRLGDGQHAQVLQTIPPPQPPQQQQVFIIPAQPSPVEASQSPIILVPANGAGPDGVSVYGSMSPATTMSPGTSITTTPSVSNSGSTALGLSAGAGSVGQLFAAPPFDAGAMPPPPQGAMPQMQILQPMMQLPPRM